MCPTRCARLRGIRQAGDALDRLPDESTILRFRHCCKRAIWLVTCCLWSIICNALLHGSKQKVFADSGYHGASKREGARGDVR